MVMIEVENYKDELALGILYFCSTFIIKTQCTQHFFIVVFGDMKNSSGEKTNSGKY